MLMMAKNDWVTILGETTSQNLDNLEGVLITMKMINKAHISNEKVKSFTSFCGSIPFHSAINNLLAD
ncbi:hypothetical protein HA466_0312750 [Hirschfeldia incana]|nr:hypothetical protein HA466_0312750 [Hirschfeldia incana]